MPHVPIVPPEQASKDVKEVYEEFYRRMSFPSPPNFIMTQGHSGTVARGTWEAVKNVLVSGAIPRWQKEMMFVAISKDRACRYCEAAHFACCRMLGVKPALLESLVRDVDQIPDPKLRDMIKFSLKCSRNPQGLTVESVETSGSGDWFCRSGYRGLYLYNPGTTHDLAIINRVLGILMVWVSVFFLKVDRF